MLKIVFDTNQLVSGLLKKDSIQARLIEAWKDQKIIAVVSNELEKEFVKVIRYSKFKKYGINEQDIKDLHTLLKTESIRVESDCQVEIQLKDSTDEKFIKAAVSGEANFIVTGDKKFLEVVAYKGIKIIIASELEEILRDKGGFVSCYGGI